MIKITLSDMKKMQRTLNAVAVILSIYIENLQDFVGSLNARESFLDSDETEDSKEIEDE